MTSEQFMGYIFILNALIIYFVFFKSVFFYAITIKKWKIADGVILSHSQYYESGSGDGGWTLKVLYSYDIRGVSFRSSEYTRNISILKPWKEWVDTFYIPPVGQKVDVYYNPENPEDAVLDSKFDYLNFLILIMGTVAIAVGYNLLS